MPYRLNLPVNIPATNFCPVTLCEAENASGLANGQPFTLQTVLQLAVATLLPVLPLTLTMISLEELLGRLLTLVF